MEHSDLGGRGVYRHDQIDQHIRDARSVVDFGAGGGGDDTSAIQACLDAADGVVFLPPREYRVTTLHVSNTVHIIGYGATIKWATDTPPDDQMIKFTAGGSVSGVTFDGELRDVTGRGFLLSAYSCSMLLEDCAFINNVKPSQVNNDEALYFSGCDGVLVSRCRFDTTGYAAIKCVHTSNVAIRDCNIKDFHSKAIVFNNICENIEIANCRITSSVAPLLTDPEGANDCILLDAGSAEGLYLKNITVRDTVVDIRGVPEGLFSNVCKTNGVIKGRISFERCEFYGKNLLGNALWVGENMTDVTNVTVRDIVTNARVVVECGVRAVVDVKNIRLDFGDYEADGIDNYAGLYLQGSTAGSNGVVDVHNIVVVGPLTNAGIHLSTNAYVTLDNIRVTDALKIAYPFTGADETRYTWGPTWVAAGTTPTTNPYNNSTMWADARRVALV